MINCVKIIGKIIREGIKLCLIQPQNPEFRINPENFHPCSSKDDGRYKQGDGRVDENTSLKQYNPITISKLGGGDNKMQ